MNAVAKLAKRLADSPLPGSKNSISENELKEWIIEYLGFYDEELASFPELVGQPHWNLWMVDMSVPDALFAVVVFHGDNLEVCCGTGHAIKSENSQRTNPSTTRKR